MNTKQPFIVLIQYKKLIELYVQEPFEYYRSISIGYTKNFKVQYIPEDNSIYCTCINNSKCNIKIDL